MAPKPSSLAARMKNIERTPVHLISTTPAPELAPSKPKAKTREGMKRATALMSPEDHKRLQILRATSGKSVEALLDEAIADLFAKHNA
jgi:hypothetical protein